MMRMIVRGLIGLFGVMFMAIGVRFLILPADAATAFAVLADGVQGLATLRADMTAFFVVGGGFALWGAWRQQAAPLWTPLLLVGIAFTGRCVGIIADGMGPMTVPPMVVEALGFALLFTGTRVFTK